MQSTDVGSKGRKNQYSWQAPIVGILSALGISLGVLAIIALLTVDSGTLDSVAMVHWWMLPFALCAVGLRVFCGSWRLRFISQRRLTWRGALRAQLAWDFFSNVTPSTIGGAPVTTAYITHDSKLPLGDSTAVMLLAMLMDQVWLSFAIVVLVISGVFVEVIPAGLGTVGDVAFMAYFALFFAWVVLFAYSMFIRPSLLSWVVKMLFRLPLLRRLQGRVESVLEQLNERAAILRSQPFPFFIKGFLLTVLTWTARYGLVVVILWGFYTELDQVLAFIRTLAMMMGALILPTPAVLAV